MLDRLPPASPLSVPPRPRELQIAARETAKLEKSGEALVRSLERQGAAFGLTRSELRSMKAEAAALAAEQQGLIELAGRIREAEGNLFAKEYAAGRKAQMDADAAAEDRAMADARAAQEAARQRAEAEAAVNAQLHERARLQSAIEKATGAGGLSASDHGASFSALAQLDRELELVEKVANAERAATEEQRRQNSILAERASLQAAIERNTGVNALSATDKGASFSALAEQAAQQEAQALAAAASAAERLAREHASLAAEVRASAAAQEADAAAADRLRASTDPLYAATARLNAEIAESTRLYHAGMTAPEEYARQQHVLQSRLQQTSAAHDSYTGSVKKNGFALTNLSFQLNDVITMAASGAKPFQILATQGGQIFQIFQQAEGGAGGLAKQVGVLALAFAPLVAILAVAAGGFALFNRAMSDGVDTDKMVQGLGLTRAEIKRLKDTSIDTGDIVAATFQVMAENIGINMSGAKKFFTDAMDWMTVKGHQYLALLYSQFSGTFRAISVIVKDVFAGKGFSDIMSDVKDAYTGAYKDADNALIEFGKKVRDRAAANKLADLQKQRDEIVKDRTPKKPKEDHHAEQLAREAQAIEAQIKNLYNLADAYGVSGAAALIAEARVKAESAAIKKRADIEEAVARQIRLAIAERVKDAAQSTAAMRNQADMQARVNAEVAAGTVPATLANELLRDRLADLPLLEAIEAARIAKDVKGAQAATDALEEQRAARVSLTDAERAAALLAAQQNGDDRLAELREELRLIGETEAVRVRALAVLRATQEASRANWTGAKAADYIQQQGDIAAAQHQVGVATNQLNQDLRLTAERADEVADAMSRAFGRVGSAIGDAISILGHYGEQQEKIDALVKAGTFTQAQGAKKSADLQMNSLLGITGAAKSLFKEHSKGYQAMAAAEKALTIIQLARTAVDVAGGAARMFATLGPYAFPGRRSDARRDGRARI
jgi:hypothetical protein